MRPGTSARVSRLALAALLGGLALPVHAAVQAPPGDRPGADEATADSAARDGFQARVLVTPDADWLQKWQATDGSPPAFRSTRSVAPGAEVFVLTFIINPALDAAGMTDVACDVLVRHPDGAIATEAKGVDCFRTRLQSDPRNVYLTQATLRFRNEAGDPKGRWQVDVAVHDRVRGTTLPLRTWFVVE